MSAISPKPPGARVSSLAGALLLAVVAAGCAPKDIILPNSEFAALGPLTVVRCTTNVQFVVKDPGRMICCGCLFGGIGVAAAKYAEASRMPPPSDYLSSVADAFVELAPRQIPSWPEMKTVDAAVQGDFRLKGRAVMDFRLGDMTVGAVHGFYSRVTARISDSQGKLVWSRTFDYTSRKAGRRHGLDDLRADCYRELRAEMALAARSTAQDLVDHLR